MTDPDATKPVEGSEPASEAPRPPQPEQQQLPPAPPRSSSPVLLVIVLAALFAVGSAVVISSLDTGEPVADTPIVHQAPLPTGPTVHLKLFVEHEEAAMELPPNVILDLGDTVMFELSAEEDAEVRVWVETDGTRTADLGTFQAGTEAGLLADGDALVAFGLGKPGTVVFRASSSEKGCGGDSCDSVVVTVRESE